MLTRATGDGKAGDSVDAQKTWVSATITIAPSATNEVGVSRTPSRSRCSKDTGTAASCRRAGEHVDVTLTDANGATHTGADRHLHERRREHGRERPVHDHLHLADRGHGHRPRDRDAHASAASPITVQTDGIAPNSGDAVKTFVDANIQITPATAANPIGTNHTLTGHVNVNDRRRRRLRERPGGHADHLHDRLRPGRFVGGDAPARRSAATGSLHRRDHARPRPARRSCGRRPTVTVGGVALHRATTATARPATAPTRRRPG